MPIYTLKNTGLQSIDFTYLTQAFNAFPEIEQVILFGSRAKGTFHKGSDVDLAIKGEAITHNILIQLSEVLNEEKPMPYFFDVIHYQKVDNDQLIEHIDRVGKVLFVKTSFLR